MNYTYIASLMPAILEAASLIMAVVAALTVVVTLIVEVIKGLFPKIPTNFVAVTVSIALTVVSMCVLCSVLEITIMWYYAVGAVVLGFFVSYAAMFGFDKFKAALEKLTKKK